ncbi:MAG TPA: RNA polymerase sigma factor [Thermoleophilaceae bacterium]
MTSDAGELALARLPARRRADRSERALIRGAQDGSREDLEELFRRYWPASYRAAYFVVYDRAAAEDIAQEAFLSALRALHRFDRRRPFGPWLHRIVVNRAIDWARARALRRELDVEPPDGELRDDVEGRDELASALARLTPERRAVVVLRYVLEYTPGEIAELLDLPRGTVNSRLRRALDDLAHEVARD